MQTFKDANICSIVKSCKLVHVTGLECYMCESSISGCAFISVSVQYSIKQSSITRLCLTLYDHMDCSKIGFSVLHYLPEPGQTYVHWVSDAINYLTLCCPLLLPPSIFPSIRIFSNELALCIRKLKYWSWSFSFQHQSFSMNIQSSFPLGLTGLISFLSKRLWRVLHHHNLKASVFWYSAFFIVQLSHPYKMQKP